MSAVSVGAGAAVAASVWLVLPVFAGASGVAGGTSVAADGVAWAVLFAAEAEPPAGLSDAGFAGEGALAAGLVGPSPSLVVCATDNPLSESTSS